MTVSFSNPAQCPFCKTSSRCWANGEQRTLYGFDCEICGQFFISQVLHGKMKDQALDSALLNCISENTRNNVSSGKYPINTSWHSRFESELPVLALDITVKRFEDFAELPIIHATKVSDLLLLLAAKAQKVSPFAEVSLKLRDLYSLKILDLEEAFFWLLQLNKSRLLDSTSFGTMEHGFSNDQIANHSFTITVLGWQAIHRAQSAQVSTKVFIAMQFKWGSDELNSIRAQYIDAIKLACKDCGYEADIVSQNHTGYITDRIISEIRMSKFVIADFTFNNQGAYYEAGLARGLGKKVIHTVMKGHTKDPDDKFKHLHFDVQQINYMEWSNPAELRGRIADRIRATIEEDL